MVEMPSKKRNKSLSHTGFAPPNMAPRPLIPPSGGAAAAGVEVAGAAADGFFTTRWTVLPLLNPIEESVFPFSRIRPEKHDASDSNPTQTHKHTQQRR